MGIVVRDAALSIVCIEGKQKPRKAEHLKEAHLKSFDRRHSALAQLSLPSDPSGLEQEGIEGLAWLLGLGGPANFDFVACRHRRISISSLRASLFQKRLSSWLCFPYVDAQMHVNVEHY